jgi:hypothetical protein
VDVSKGVQQGQKVIQGSVVHLMIMKEKREMKGDKRPVGLKTLYKKYKLTSFIHVTIGTAFLGSLEYLEKRVL